MSLNEVIEYQKLFLDMDSFFASCEQQVQPPLREKPVVVAPYTGNTGCVIAASKSAKKLGIKAGFSVGKAKDVCREVVVIEARPQLYYFYHQQIVRMLNNISPFVKVLSIDEMTITLSPSERNNNTAMKIGADIKQRIHDIGDFLTCSVGVGPNQFLAKLTAESKKPDALAIIETNNLRRFYSGLKLLDITGINFQTEKALNSINIKTALELYLASQEKLVGLFNHPGKAWYLRLRGFEVDDVTSTTRTVGHSYVLPPKYRRKEIVKKVLIKLASRIGYRLRKKKLYAERLSLTIYFLNKGVRRCYVKTSFCADTATLIKLTTMLFSEIEFIGIPLTIYLTAFHLVGETGQQNLFRDKEKLKSASKMIDQINDKYGPNTIYTSDMQDMDEAAPDRIPFGSPEKQNYSW